jgi:hypothetical protein
MCSIFYVLITDHRTSAAAYEDVVSYRQSGLLERLKIFGLEDIELLSCIIASELIEVLDHLVHDNITSTSMFIVQHIAGGRNACYSILDDSHL